jgi:hypothetical protein
MLNTMKKRDKKQQDKIHKITTKRALYEKARKQKIALAKRKSQEA